LIAGRPEKAGSFGKEKTAAGRVDVASYESDDVAVEGRVDAGQENQIENRASGEERVVLGREEVKGLGALGVDRGATIQGRGLGGGRRGLEALEQRRGRSRRAVEPGGKSRPAGGRRAGSYLARRRSGRGDRGLGGAS
jgi:hypothetical protein